MVSNKTSSASGDAPAKDKDTENITPKVQGRKESMDTIVGAAARFKYGNNQFRKNEKISRKRASYPVNKQNQ